MQDNDQKLEFKHLRDTISKFLEKFNAKITRIKELKDIETIKLKDIKYHHFAIDSIEMKQIDYAKYFK